MNTVFIIIAFIVVVAISGGVGIYLYTGDRSAGAAEVTTSSPSTPSAPTASKWQCLEGFNVPLRFNASGDVECMSPDATNCAWQSSDTACNTLITNPVSPLKPLTCGTMHQSIYGGTGYDTATHWCAVGKSKLAK